MTTSDVKITPGSGANVATYDITEDSETKKIQRVAITDSTGAGVTTATHGSKQTLSVEIVDSSGNQVSTFGGSGGTASNVGSAVPATATASGFSDGTNMQVPRVFDVDTGAGTQYVKGVNLRISASGGSVEGGTASNPLRTDPTGTTTQPVSASSLPLPTGAATAAKQPALGTAGTPSSDVITVQGATSMTALKVDGSAVTQPVSAASLPLPTGASTSANQTTANSSLSTIATNSGTQATAANQTSVIGTKAAGTAAASALLVGGVYNSAGITLTTGQQASHQFDASGNLKVNIQAGAGSGGTAIADEATFTQGTTSFTPIGGFYNTTITNLTAGQGGALQLSNDRNLLVKGKLWDGTNTATVRAGSSAVASTDTALVVVARDANANGQTTMSASAPVVIASDQSSVPVKPTTTNLVSGAISTAMTGTTSTSLIAAPGAGLNNYITQITVSNSHATVGTDILIQDGSAGTTLYVIPAAAAYGGATITFPVPLKQPTANTALFCANVTTGSSTKVSASGFKA